jgi:acetoin utilization protein AcuB
MATVAARTGNATRTRGVLRVRDVMKSPASTIRDDQSLDIANATMELGRFRHLPVVSHRGADRLVGLITHRDVLRSAGRAFFEKGVARERMLRQVPVAEIMQVDVETTSPDEPAVAAARKMLDRKIGCLPVVDRHGRVVGIVTETDLVALAVRALSAGAGLR